MLPAKVELGRYLFYDLRLSANGKGSCSTCHMQQFGFTDQRPAAVGVTGQSHPRRVMPLANVAWFAVFNWANPTVTQLEDQSLTPLFNDHPIELGLVQQNDRFLQAVATDPTYRRLFPAAFPGDSGPYTFVHVRKALAAFERTLISGNSPYDHYRYRHEENAISASAKRGEDLFFHAPLSCSRCHGGFTFGGETIYQTTDDGHGIEFQNNGLYNLAGKFSYPADNLGVYEFTHNPTDVGKFRPPSLRLICMTAVSTASTKFLTTTSTGAALCYRAQTRVMAARIRISPPSYRDSRSLFSSAVTSKHSWSRSLMKTSCTILNSRTRGRPGEP
jgi:cytochrome c peroxidase